MKGDFSENGVPKQPPVANSLRMSVRDPEPALYGNLDASRPN